MAMLNYLQKVAPDSVFVPDKMDKRVLRVELVALVYKYR